MDRRDLMKVGAGALASTLMPAAAMAKTKEPVAKAEQSTEKWGCFEASAKGPTTGNPFLDVKFSARFTFEHRTVDVPGFYDGEGIYRVRFMPDSEGHWSYETVSNVKELSGQTGAFLCTPAKAGNHGPVTTAHQFHFEYADGTPYFPFGTTCYAYTFTGKPYETEVLEGLKSSGMNKARICLLPKGLGKRKPIAMPFEHIGTPVPEGAENLGDHNTSAEKFDLTKLNPKYFQYAEARILELQAIGVEADIILFHPYDSWGFKGMKPEEDDRYLRYVIARLSAYRNVWWSIANEFDLVKTKTMTDWDRFFKIVVESDPSSHLRSIHHSKVIYDHSKPWATHASLQEWDFEKSATRRAAWNKPIIYDEIQYEGNSSSRWGNLSGEEMTRRFWHAIIVGTYATHGEVLSGGDAVWSDAGKLMGSSPERIGWLLKLLQDIKTTGLNAPDVQYYLNANDGKSNYLWYFDFHCVGEYDFPLPEKMTFKAEMIDPWAMTRTPVSGTFTGKSHIKLSGKPYQAILFTKV